MAVRSGLKKHVFRKYPRKWTEKQTKSPLDSGELAFPLLTPWPGTQGLLSHAALPPGRFHSLGSQIPATPGPRSLGCALQVTCGPGTRKTVSDADLGADCTKPPKRLSWLHRPEDCVGTARCFAPAVRQEGGPEPVGGNLQRSPQGVGPAGPLQGTLRSGSQSPSSSALLLFSSLSLSSPPPQLLPSSPFFLPSPSSSSQACVGRVPGTFCTLRPKGNRRPERVPQTLRIKSDLWKVLV